VRKRFEGLENIPEPSMRESEREDEVLVMLANGNGYRLLLLRCFLSGNVP
jgi:DNA-binding CsgD family transcriptional regulator